MYIQVDESELEFCGLILATWIWLADESESRKALERQQPSSQIKLKYIPNSVKYILLSILYSYDGEHSKAIISVPPHSFKYVVE